LLVRYLARVVTVKKRIRLSRRKTGRRHVRKIMRTFPNEKGYTDK